MQTTGRSWGTDGAALSLGLPKVGLEIVRGRARNKIREVRGGAFLIGSAADCDLVLGDTRYAEVHSYLLLSPERVTIRHLGFGPGLSVGGQDVTWAALSNNDQLQTGPYEFRVRIEWPAARSGGECNLGPFATFHRLHTTGAEEAADRLLRDLRQEEPAARPLSLYVEADHETVAADDSVAKKSCNRCKSGCAKPGHVDQVWTL
jgi:hypothetical protein